jgi:hypothetical protein
MVGRVILFYRLKPTYKMSQENALNTAHYFIGNVVMDDAKGVVANITVNDRVTQLPWTITIPVTILTVPKHPCFVVVDETKRSYVVRSRIALPVGF